MAINHMDLNEFRSGGYLQEVNRRFFNPLGLALEVETDGENEEVKYIKGIVDCRDNAAGIYFDTENCDEEHLLRFHKNKCKIDEELEHKRSAREKDLGYFIQPAECPNLKKETENGTN